LMNAWTWLARCSSLSLFLSPFTLLFSYSLFLVWNSSGTHLWLWSGWIILASTTLPQYLGT
jgi:hypothetical protein